MTDHSDRHDLHTRVNSVRTGVGQLPGVRDVQVDLPAGVVTVTSDQPLDEQVVAAAAQLPPELGQPRDHAARHTIVHTVTRQPLILIFFPAQER